MKLMDQVCQLLRLKHYSLATERCYCQWIRRYIFFHGVKHPNTMGAEEAERFLSHLATVDKVSASTQNQALNALVFLYRQVMRMDLGSRPEASNSLRRQGDLRSRKMARSGVP